MEPIIEQIAIALLAKINEITLVNDYQQDLHAHRPKQVDYDNLLAGRAPTESGTVLVTQTEDRDGKAEEIPENTEATDQDFVLTAFILQAEKSADPLDTLINRAIADIRKKLMTNKGQWSTLFKYIKRGPAKIFREAGYSGAELTFTVTYWTKIDDPYTQL